MALLDVSIKLHMNIIYIAHEHIFNISTDLGVSRDALFSKIGEGLDHLVRAVADHLEKDFADLQGSYHWLVDKVEGCILWWPLWVFEDAHQNQTEHTADQILQYKFV